MTFQNIMLPLFGIIVMVYVFLRVKRNQFSIELSIFWMLIGFTIFLLSIFPKLLDIISQWVGIYYPPSVLFLISTILLLFVIFRQEQMLSKLNENLKDLAQSNALLEGRVKALEEQPSR
ncbi:MAG: DUF2304 domain-containing protein [Candidatus Marinimicrobia bacterium]|nr:DUF2304 domain-containing protein [Candidatus Neomarinimicrobiota bacterium]